MHKRETMNIVLITVAILLVIVINAWIMSSREPDILDIPITEQADEPVPDFIDIENVQEKKEAFFNYLRPEVEKQNEYLLSLRHYIQTLQRQISLGETLTEDDQERVVWLVNEYKVDEDAEIDDQLQTLLRRVDILPVSLVLAQAPRRPPPKARPGRRSAWSGWNRRRS